MNRKGEGAKDATAKDGTAKDGARKHGPGKATPQERSTPNPGTGKKPARGRRADLNEQVIERLEELRATVKEMVERYELRLASRIVELSTTIRGDASLGLQPRPLTVRTATALLAAMDAVKVKPRKGRAKDFARVEALTETLLEIAPPPP